MQMLPEIYGIFKGFKAKGQVGEVENSQKGLPELQSIFLGFCVHFSWKYSLFRQSSKFAFLTFRQG